MGNGSEKRQSKAPHAPSKRSDIRMAKPSGDRRRTPLPLSTLTPISEALGADKSPSEVLQLILKAAHSITRASTASLMLTEPGTDILRVKAAEGFKDDSIYKTDLIIGQGVTGWVAETGVPLRLGNVTADPRYIRVQRGLRSELAVPLKIRGQVIGVISVDSTRLDHFSPEDEVLLLSLAAHSARVIQTMRLHEETHRRADELRLLIEAGRVLTSTLDQGQVLLKLVKMTAEFWRAPMVAVYLASEDGKLLSLAAVHGGSPSTREQPGQALKTSYLRETLRGHKDTVVIENLRESMPPEQYESLLISRDQPAGTLLAAPLMAKKRALGVLCVYDRKGRTFTLDERRLLAGLSTSAALAIENAHVHRRILEAEESLRDAEKTNLLVEMAGGLAHEIRNPLTSIKILNEALVKSMTLSEEDSNDVRMVQRQVERLESIVNGFLDSARAHAAVMRQDILDLNSCVDETLMLLATSADEGTRMTCGLHKGKLLVKGDLTQLSQVVYNLVLNAIQAVAQQGQGKARGRVEIRTGKTEEVPGRVFFEVLDEGPGLPDKVQERLFQPFVTTKDGGVGLGLSIVRRIVKAHDGSLEIESPREGMDHGACFRMLLPEAPG